MNSRDAILAAALRRLNTDPRASMTDMAGAAGVGRATLHRYFSSRDELLHELGTRSLNRWEQSMTDADLPGVIESGDPDRIRECLRELLRRYLADYDEFGFALIDPYLRTAPDLVERTEELAERESALLAAGQRAGVLRADLPPRWLSFAVYGVLVAARDATTSGRVARHDLDEFVISTYFDGTAAR
ncbi:TetR/AcrR family transcriptional regulator [Kineosporia sp. J2-2]|uniref:TetR/AcrR family transcriptional regulator n=1 Tax=Kineosporia corallincola TaxID=2835133 RepID=A0ABS5TLS2_9ACTN|nr:TetR/AcrR family transcriptional regulator [Kineosporia corallincola]MBT0772054.1 TetR/AcrR family transcriptional regulator [Kineosporia corallincola]